LGGGLTAPPSPTYTEVFNEVFPYYLTIGMTYDQFWNEDCALVRFYRKADELQRKRRNEELWLQGMYVYDALCCVAPILHAFAKSGTKPTAYPDRPYPITKAEVEAERERQEQLEVERLKAQFQSMVANLKIKG